MPITAHEIETLLRAGFPDAQIKVQGDDDMDLIGQVTRRNQSLEQSSRYGGRGHWASASILPKRFKDDDIGYARKFHKTFQKGKSTNDR